MRYGDLINPTHIERLESEKNEIFVPVRYLSNDLAKMCNNPFLSDVEFLGFFMFSNSH